MAINIQRARDHGLPDYNTAREVYGLPRITRFEDINPTAFKNPLNPEFETVRSVSGSLLLSFCLSIYVSVFLTI